MSTEQFRAEFQEVVTTKKLFACPECGSLEHFCDHLNQGDQFGPWYCDKCGCSILGTVTASGADIEIQSRRKSNTLVLLRLDVAGTEENPIHIVVRGVQFYEVGEQPELDSSGNEYFYNLHTCPWNYLSLPIKEGDDTDPHGLFVFQEAVLMPDEYHDHLGDIDQWRELFPSLRPEANRE